MKTAVAILCTLFLFGAPAQDVGAEASFPEGEWETLRGLMKTGGVEAVVGYVAGFADPAERLALFGFARPAFAYREWAGKNLDDLVTVGEAGIEEALRQADLAADDDARRELVEWANVEAYNLSADLAECWPGDDLPRERRHFEKGVELADRCLAWREELGKGPFAFSLAYWARGMHDLSLWNVESARGDFAAALEYSKTYAVEEGLPADCVPGGEFTVILNNGYLGLALWIQKDPMGPVLYYRALGAFRGTAADFPEMADDAQFGIEQLEKVRGIFIGEK
ncbi:MAG TPA: hypothetical protein VM054_00740 [bacterium]|nr:hypothetical protein [bacterium]